MAAQDVCGHAVDVHLMSLATWVVSDPDVQCQSTRTFIARDRFIIGCTHSVLTDPWPMGSRHVGSVYGDARAVVEIVQRTT